MTVISAQKERRFVTKNGDRHLIDSRGNHFINGKCANPCIGTMEVEDVDGKLIQVKTLGEPIGSTYPPESEIVK